MTDPKDPIRPVIHRFAWGDATITTVLDGSHLREPLRPPFAMDKDDAALAAIAAEHRLPHDCFENTYTQTVIDTGSQVVLIDVGFGAAGRPGGSQEGAGMLRERLGEAGYAPEAIDVVAFTHMHPDHILGLREGEALAYPNARHVIGRREFEEWASGANIPEQRQKNREMFLQLIAPMKDELSFVEDGDEVVPGVTAEAAFGHSLGHMMYRLRSGGKELLVWGDVTNHYAFSLPHPDSPVGFDDHKEQAKAERRRVLSMVAEVGTLVIGHHMPFPAVGYVERRSEGFRWVPATYQIWS